MAGYILDRKAVWFIWPIQMRCLLVSSRPWYLPIRIWLDGRLWPKCFAIPRGKWRWKPAIFGPSQSTQIRR